MNKSEERLAFKLLSVDIAVATGLSVKSEQVAAATVILWKQGYRPERYRD